MTHLKLARDFIERNLVFGRELIMIKGKVGYEVFVEELANALSKSHEEGRRAGLEEAAKIAQEDLVFGSLPYPENRRSWNQGSDDTRKSIVKAIRQQIGGGESG